MFDNSLKWYKVIIKTYLRIVDFIGPTDSSFKYLTPISQFYINAAWQMSKASRYDSNIPSDYISYQREKNSSLCIMIQD